MNIALVDPIAATANITARSWIQPEVPAIADAQSLRETKLVELASALAGRGHRATVVFGDVFLDGHAGSVSDGVSVAPVETVLRFPFHPGLFPATPSLVNHPAFGEADVIQVGEFHQPSTYFACLAARERSVPVVVWQETFRRMRFPGSVYQRAYESTFGRFVRARGSGFVPRTTKAMAYLHDLQVPGERIGPWVPTGVDTRAFAPGASRLTGEDFGWDREARILLIVARLHPTKGIDLALRTLRWVLRRHPEVRLLVRGGGPERGALLRSARDLGIEDAVRIVGPRPRADMVDLYHLASVVMNTSLVDLLPFSLMEAGACGRPCVATDVGAIRDIVVDGATGVVVADRTPEGVGTALCSLLRNEGLREALGTAARARAERHFALPVVADRLLEVYRNVGA